MSDLHSLPRLREHHDHHLADHVNLLFSHFCPFVVCVITIHIYRRKEARRSKRRNMRNDDAKRVRGGVQNWYCWARGKNPDVLESPRRKTVIVFHVAQRCFFNAPGGAYAQMRS